MVCPHSFRRLQIEIHENENRFSVCVAVTRYLLNTCKRGEGNGSINLPIEHLEKFSQFQFGAQHANEGVHKLI